MFSLKRTPKPSARVNDQYSFMLLCSCKKHERIMANKVSGKTMNLTILLFSCVAKFAVTMLYHSCIRLVRTIFLTSLIMPLGRFVPILVQRLGESRANASWQLSKQTCVITCLQTFYNSCVLACVFFKTNFNIPKDVYDLAQTNYMVFAGFLIHPVVIQLNTPYFIP